jgi:tripartite-type tricarboxylate transporter receptor subunit TctC
MRVASAFALLLVTLLLAPCAIAQAQPSFYHGRTINLIIGYPPAGANDVYARLVARHLGRHIPGNPAIVPRNLPGAGSLLAASRIFNAEPKDGTTLGLLVPTIPLDEKLENPAAKYRAADFNWIGRMAPAPNITFIMSTSAVKTIWVQPAAAPPIRSIRQSSTMCSAPGSRSSTATKGLPRR